MNVCKDDASILIIYTGGTIGMIENPETGSLEAFNFEHLEEHVPELKNLGYKISSIQFDPPMDSSEMGPDSWMKIVHVIAEHYHDYDGFVVLHGTDTMAFTVLSLLLNCRRTATLPSSGGSRRRFMVLSSPPLPALVSVAATNCVAG